MFLAWNEIKRNKLKFSLIIGVLIMISYLLFLLSGLASGLMNMNREGIDKWQADAIVLNKDANQTVEQSLFNTDDIENTYKNQTTLKQSGVIVSNGNNEENALLFGVTDHSFLVPDMIEGKKFNSDNEVIADETLKDKGFKIGDKLSLSQSDENLKIVGFSESAKYNASPVLFSNNNTIQKINPSLDKSTTNAVVVKDKNWNNQSLNNNLEAIGIESFVENLPGYTAQNLTLNFMISFLFIISATVIGIFLYVITLQKTNLFGVLKAQGFTNGYLAKVVLSQTFIIAMIGTLIGLILTLITGAFLPSAVPIKFSAVTLIIYGVVLIVVSLIGSLFSILTIRKVDPLKAIG
ncbi:MULTISPECIES: ABC transporter permease [Staphylococcus]|jgi:putative ABC transport system permease protein|uniref:Putative hemin transport system permease protein HrtB n=1 Tax=Staphylococcus nepalensis TaxID=214473 RepID=A0A2T4S995_9STAP|nr:MULTISPECIES: FtsX-like permease family protein [Staphylococcus]MBO1206345.1 FtsX-like permease family protein [Staphylococcus nepalensis]MBO1212354.1 FtsX-like permease family protein [Staphylococcus nepalensis]MBO1217009.1 FtsX-like permease family protein [Staphylococcus nepalensis]MBO1220789.1 FtsX-like permease family protein [Staphylococcus nepalensis]MBO1228306.1 FtsX-like permease family protein [Staphylococcus nepalensis]